MKKIIYAMSIFIAMSVSFASCTQCCKQKEVSEPEIAPATEVQQPDSAAVAAAEAHKAHRVIPETVSEESTKTEAIQTIHNARISLDWAGTYKGTLPCADCEGIAVTLVLRNDGTYDLVYHYLGIDALPYEVMGKFTWSEDGSEIILDAENTNTPTRYKVLENKLIELDLSGKMITGKLANMYILKKQ